MFGTVIDVFKSFFSRSFWFGNFLPVAIFSFLHLVVAWWVIPGIPLATWANADPKSLTYFPVAFAALVAAAYVLMPVIPLVRGLLDGSLLPEGLHDLLRRQHVIETRAIQRRINAAYDRLNQAGTLKTKKLESIWNTRRNGNARLAAGDPVIGNEPAIGAVRRAIVPLQEAYDAGRSLDFSTLGAAADLLVVALGQNATELPDNYNGPDREKVAGLNGLQTQLVELLRGAEADADNRQQALTTLYSRIAYDNPQATRMADTRFLVERYPADAYNADFDYIWPRLQLVLPTKGDQADVGSFSEKLSSARAQIDFAVLSLGLSLTIPLAWLPYLAWTATNPVKFLVIGGVAPLLVVFFYNVCVEAQIAFGDAMKAAIDNYRLELLGKVLRQKLPATLSDERDLWGLLKAIDRLRDSDLIYQYPKPQS